MFKNETEKIKQKIDILLKENKKDIVIIAIDGMTGNISRRIISNI